MLYVVRVLNENSYLNKMWLWIVLAIIAVVLYVASNYSKVKVAKKSCSTCTNAKTI